MGVIGPDLQGHFAISTQNSKKRHSMSLLFTNLGQPRSVHVQHALVFYKLIVIVT